MRRKEVHYERDALYKRCIMKILSPLSSLLFPLSSFLLVGNYNK
jgi:hypothetical protein